MEVGVSTDPLPSANSPMPSLPLKPGTKLVVMVAAHVPKKQFWLLDGCILPQRQNVLEMLWLGVGLTCFHSLTQKIR